jgi:hypothetical protein
MPDDETADLIGSCEATLDTLGLLLGDIGEEVQDSGDSWTIAQILNHLVDFELRHMARVRRMRRETNPRMRAFRTPTTTGCRRSGPGRGSTASAANTCGC